MSEHDGKDAAFGAAHAQSYAAGARRQVPGLDGLHRMMSQLLAELVPADGRVLVLGAGGGLELKVLADAHAGWTFDGVDPSADMLRGAAHMLGPHAGRVQLVEGYIEDAPEAAFDGAVCLLTFHFIARDKRLSTLREIHRRLRPGAPFVLAHISFAQTEPERSQWIARHVAFGGVEPERADAAREAIGTRLTIVSPEEEEAMLAAAGFSGVELFYAGMSLRGWVGYA